MKLLDPQRMESVETNVMKKEVVGGLIRPVKVDVYQDEQGRLFQVDRNGKRWRSSLPTDVHAMDEWEALEE